MHFSVLCEDQKLNDNRVSVAPDTVKKLVKLGLDVLIESQAGLKAGYADEDYVKSGAKIVSRDQARQADIVAKINPPNTDEVKSLKPNSYFISLLNSWEKSGPVSWLNEQKVTAFALERVPRTSRAQSMDVLSSQANLAGYRAVLESTVHYQKFLPLMMTSAGMSKPAKLVVLGAGVAGLQAIATAKRLGASVEAYDIRPEVKEQIQSLGAKFIELDVKEQGSGQGGYAKELSEEGKKRQQSLLNEYLKSANIIISTANIPGRKAPVLITADAVKGMKRGSVIIDLAAGTGGNCELTKPDQIVEVDGVKVVGVTNYPSLLASDASLFFGNNIYNFLSLVVKKNNNLIQMDLNFEDDIVTACCVCHQGQLRV